jgi:hypothetical protein
MQPLTRASLVLLRTIDTQDQGDGVVFIVAPRSRWTLPGTNYTVNSETFRVLGQYGLIDVGNGHGDPVRLTIVGRELIKLFKSPSSLTEAGHQLLLRQKQAGHGMG